MDSDTIQQLPVYMRDTPLKNILYINVEKIKVLMKNTQLNSMQFTTGLCYNTLNKFKDGRFEHVTVASMKKVIINLERNLSKKEDRLFKLDGTLLSTYLMQFRISHIRRDTGITLPTLINYRAGRVDATRLKNIFDVLDWLEANDPEFKIFKGLK